MRVGIYIRVSTQDQSTELQREEITALLRARGIEQFTVYEDKATGTNGSRPGLQRMLADVAAMKLDLVVCWKLDRLFRSLMDLMNTLDFFTKHGVKFISVKDNLDLTTASGMLLMQILGAVAEFEGALIRERVRAGLKSAKARGVRLGTPFRKDNRYKQIRELRKTGRKVRVVAAMLGVSEETVYRACRR